MKEKNINQLIADHLWGSASEKDNQRLTELLSENSELRQRFDQLLNNKELAERYRQYAAINPTDKLQVISDKCESSLGGDSSSEGKQTSHFSLLTSHFWLRAAAVIICIVTFGALWFTYDSRLKAPELSDEVMAAITLAEQSGKNQAVLTVGGQPVSITGEQAIDKVQAVNTRNSTPNTPDRTLTTHHDSEFWLTLDDGTRVHLNYGTTLTYPQKFDGDIREVELDGEAYFFVAKDNKHPFIVHTPNGSVKVYGTEFNVNTRDDAGLTRVVLVSGSISVMPSNGREQMMKPGEMAVLSTTGCQFSTVDITPYVSWNTGTFAFADCPLEKLMRVLSHWYNKRVEFDSEETRQMQFTGTINKYGDIEPALKAIHNVTGLRITINGNLITISQHN